MDNEEMRVRGIAPRHYNASFENYEHNEQGQLKALTACIRLCDDLKAGRTPKNIILSGSVGTGKTHLMSAIVKRLYSQNVSSILTSASDIIDRARTAYSGQGTCKEAIGAYLHPRVLLIDEVGVQAGTDNERKIMYDTIDERYKACKTTIIASNLDMKGIEEMIGVRCIDRLREDGGVQLNMNWDSYRNKTK